MKKLTAFVLPFVLATQVALAADQYTIDASHTWPMFAVNHLGFSTQHGRFDKTSGKITLDMAAKSGKVELTIDANSLDMGDAKWDEHMKGADFFNTAKFATLTFKADKLQFDGDKVVGADGQFTLLGVTRPLHLTVTNFKCGAHPMFKRQVCGAEISAVIKRSDYGMSKYVPMVGDEVKLTSSIEALRDE